LGFAFQGLLVKRIIQSRGSVVGGFQPLAVILNGQIFGRRKQLNHRLLDLGKMWMRRVTLGVLLVPESLNRLVGRAFGYGLTFSLESLDIAMKALHAVFECFEVSEVLLLIG